MMQSNPLIKDLVVIIERLLPFLGEEHKYDVVFAASKLLLGQLKF